MSHITYQTDGIVIGSLNIKEGDKLLSVFTKELGLINAVARSVREERSKLRYALEQFSNSEISFIRGREAWRITGAQLKNNFYRDCLNDKIKRLILARITSLLRRLVRGEGENRELYSLVSSGFSFLSKTSLSRDQIDAFEQLFVLRMLYLLGYLAPENTSSWGLDTHKFDEGSLENLNQDRRKIIQLINSAIRETQL